MERFVGTWRLVDWNATVGDVPERPFGGKATGLLTYTADGRMSAALMRTDRRVVPSRTLGSATAADRARAAGGYLSYAGSYRVEGNEVVHTVEVSLFPNWVGGEQRRSVEWISNPIGGKDLILSALSQPAGRKPVMNRLRWRRLTEWDID
jgi:hypothetical protein